MKIVKCRQTHSDNIYLVNESDVGKIISDCDGLITDLKNIRLEIKTADCLPLTFNDDVTKVVGVVHAGWKGTEKKIAEKAVKILVEKYNCNPKDIKVKIGPSIDKDNYLVRNDLYKIFSKEYPQYLEEIDDDQWRLDLKGINRSQLLNSGILEKNINISSISTYNDKNYPSFRRDGKSKGFVTSVMIK